MRVFAHEIRKKLEAYYANEGVNDSIRLEIPAGSYQPVFTRQLPEPVDEPSETSLPFHLILSTNVYTGQCEAIGLHYLTGFFRKASRSIQLKRSRTMSAEGLKKRNLIILGGVWVNEWSSKLTRNENFVFTSKATIENRNPRPGEEREYIPQFDRQSGNLISDYALITVKPNLSDANEVMLLAGIYNQGTEAAAEYVTNKNYLDQLNQRLQRKFRIIEEPVFVFIY